MHKKIMRVPLTCVKGTRYIYHRECFITYYVAHNLYTLVNYQYIILVRFLYTFWRSQLKLSNHYKRNIKLNSDDGGALAFVIIMIMVLSIFVSSILFLFNNNLVQAKKIENSMEAYYLAYSGVEMSYAALLANTNEKMKSLTDLTVTSLTTNNISFGNGKINTQAVLSTDPGFEDWIKITVVATLDKNGDTDTRIMYFDPNDPTKKVWKDN